MSGTSEALHKCYCYYWRPLDGVESTGLKSQPASIPFWTAPWTVWLWANFFFLCVSTASSAICVIWNW